MLPIVEADVRHEFARDKAIYGVFFTPIRFRLQEWSTFHSSHFLDTTINISNGQSYVKAVFH